MADDIRRWSDELARDPSSLVFLQLGEALRRQGQLEVALKIALRGLERHPRNVDAHRSRGAHRRGPSRLRARVRRVGARAANRARSPRRDEGARLRLLSPGPARRGRAVLDQARRPAARAAT